MLGINNKRKVSISKDPTLVAGTGGFAATLKFLEQTDKKSSPRRGLGASLMPDFKYADIKRNGGGVSSENSSISSTG